MYYLNSRYYDPETGRFVNADDVSNSDTRNINGLNLFMYCASNPVKYYDPNGNSFLVIGLILLGGAIIGGAIGGKVAYDSGERGWDLAGKILLGASLGLAGAGLVVSGVAVIAGAFGATTIFGVTTLQAFAMGTLAYNLVAPIAGITMEIIEYDTPNQPEQQTYNPPMNQYPTTGNISYKQNYSITYIVQKRRKNNAYISRRSF